MKKPNPSGRTPLLGPAGAPVPVQPEPRGPEPPRLTPTAAKPAVPYHHGRRDWDTLDRIGKARREGNCPVPAWQLTLKAGCVRCFRKVPTLPVEAHEARLRLEGLGWRFEGGRWLCGECLQCSE